jgi:asparagine synthase (glutamine-hydrolysing)
MLRGDTPAAASYRASRTLFSESQLAALTGSINGPVESAQVIPDGIDMTSLSLMQQVSVYELTGYMRNTLLRDSDVFSMAHGVELRVPFVDVKVARAAFAAAGNPESDRKLPKQLLIDAVKDLLPPGHLNLPKRGFTLPFERWMRSEMFGEVDSVFTGSSLQETGLDGAGTASIWKQFQSGRAGVNWSRPWALYTLARWASLNGVHGIAGVAH